MQDSKKDTEGGMIWKYGIETCILSCKNQIASLCPMQDTACLPALQMETQLEVKGKNDKELYEFGALS